MYRESDEACNEPDEAPEDEKRLKFRERWDCLSKESSDMVRNRVGRNIYTCGYYFQKATAAYQYVFHGCSLHAEPLSRGRFPLHIPYHHPSTSLLFRNLQLTSYFPPFKDII